MLSALPRLSRGIGTRSLPPITSIWPWTRELTFSTTRSLHTPPPSQLPAPPPHIVLDVETDGIHTPRAVCAVTLETRGTTGTTETTSGSGADGSPPQCPHPHTIQRWYSPNSPTGVMTSTTAASLVNHLFDHLPTHSIVSFNSSFGFQALYNVLDPDSPEATKVKMLPFTSRDLFTCFACSHGHFTSLGSLLGNIDTVTESGVAPAHIPELWASGDPKAHEAVLAHCENDANVIHKLYCHACAHGTLTRLAGNGATHDWQVDTDDDGSVVRPVWKALEQFAKSPPPYRHVNMPKKFQWAGTYDWS